MASAVITTKGQVTVPIEVRKDLGLKTGDRLEFVRNAGTGRYEIARKTGSIMDLCGILKHEGPPMSDEEMDEAIGRHLGEEDERIKREWNEWKAQQS